MKIETLLSLFERHNLEAAPVAIYGGEPEMVGNKFYLRYDVYRRVYDDASRQWVRGEKVCILNQSDGGDYHAYACGYYRKIRTFQEFGNTILGGTWPQRISHGGMVYSIRRSWDAKKRMFTEVTINARVDSADGEYKPHYFTSGKAYEMVNSYLDGVCPEEIMIDWLVENFSI